MIEISDRLFAAFIGPNWSEHYRDAFDRIEDGSRRGLLKSWNTAAAVVPFWFVHRRLTTWSIIFFLLFLVLYAVFATGFALFSWMRHEMAWLPIIPAYLTTSLIQGFAADTLLYQRALRAINKVRRSVADQHTAVRQLSQLAPSDPPGAYVTHTLLSAVGIPIWAIATWMGVTALAPNYSEPQSVYIALMRTALRDLVVMQENFFFEAAQYSNDLDRLSYTAPAGVSIMLTSASDSGWSATASHAMVAAPCTIFVGRGQSTEGREEGIPQCP